MLVADLKSVLEGVQERSIPVTLGNVEVSEDASTMTIPGEEFVFDEQIERTLSSYLGINKSYLAKCPPDLKATNLNYWLARRENQAAVIEAAGDNIISIHKPGLVVLPLHSVAEVITRTFDPQNEIVTLIRNDTRFHIDIQTPHHVEVPTDDRIEDRTRGDRQIGDITHGGVRILANPTEKEAPRVMTYLHRLWCTNGSTSPESEGAIRIKGQTVEQVLEELELAAQRVMGDLDNKLAEYAALAQLRPPGSPAKFAYQLGAEYGLTQQVMRRVMERVSILPEDASLYDVQQIFTSIANGNVRYDTMMRLQTLGGAMAFNTEHIVHRCGQCTRLLPGDA